jgi:hypothetical protein
MSLPFSEPDGHHLDDILRKDADNTTVTTACRHVTSGRVGYRVHRIVAKTVDAIEHDHPGTDRGLLYRDITSIMSVWPLNRRPHHGCGSIGVAAADAGLPVTVIERVNKEPYETILREIGFLTARLSKHDQGICYTRLLYDWQRLRYRYTRPRGGGPTIADTVKNTWLSDYTITETTTQEKQDSEQP